MTKGIKILIALYLLCFNVTCWANTQKGVYFKSKEVSLEQRTGLDLTKQGAIAYKNRFTIEFDISFRDLTIRYGHIFQLLETEQNHQLDLICKDEDVFVIFDKKETKLQLGFLEEHKGLVNRWMALKLTINTQTGEAELFFDGQSVKDKIDLPVKSALQWTFGIVNKYGFEIDEVAPISLRNIRFLEQGKLKYCWPLDYSQKNAVKDSVQGKAAHIINPAWVMEQHQEWKKIRTLDFSSRPQIAFNQKTEEIYFIQRKEGIIKYNLNEQLESKLTYNKGNPYYEDAQQIFFDKNNKLRVYSDYKDLCPMFDECSGTWDNSFDTIAYLPKYWHSNNLIHPIDSSYVSIGGYGYFTYFNDFRVLQEDYSWKVLELKGDIYSPRYLSALGQAEADKNVYYLFGGLGNESGKQILGKEFYYDLYKINFEADSISKEWEWNDELLNESYTPVNSLIVNESEDCFYTLCFSHGNNKTNLQLVKAQLSSSDFKFIGSKIPYIFTDVSSFADLYNWRTHNKLVAITMNKVDENHYEIDLYGLNYPPSEVLPENNAKIAQAAESKIGFLVAIVVGIIALIILLLLARRRLAQNNKQLLVWTGEDESKVDIAPVGKILSFGGFKTLDKHGKDITYRFSPTLKELFLLILLHTVDDNKGISSKQIQQYLWPDKSDNKAKNNRGVNIKKLRAILDDIGNVSIVFDGNYWRVVHGDQVFCDIEFIRKYYLKENNLEKRNEFEKVINVLSRGSFLVNIEAEWLDKVKEDISGRIVNRLEEASSLLDLRVHEKELLRVADVLFTFDQMNETALEIKCSILNHQGKHSLALEIYTHYTKLYTKLYNEDFARSFKDLVV